MSRHHYERMILLKSVDSSRNRKAMLNRRPEVILKMEDAYRSILSALNSSLSSSTSSENRKMLEAYLVSRKSTPDYVQVLSYILKEESPDHCDAVRTLALTLLHDWIVSFWTNIDLETQNNIRSTVVSLLSGQRPPASRGFRTKLAAVLSCIAVRQFPHAWESFLEDMVTTWQSSSIDIQEVAIMVIDFTVTDCISSGLSSSLPTSRKQNILGGFKAMLTPLLEATFRFLCMYLEQLMVLRQVPGSGGRELAGTINTLLRMVGTLISFSKPGDVCASPHDFSAVCVQLLNYSEIQMEVCSLLLAVTAVKLPRDLFVSLLKQFCEHPVQVLPDDDDERSAFQMTFSECIHSLLTSNVSLLLSPDNATFFQQDEQQQLLGNFFLLLVSTLKQPIRRVAVCVVGDWTKICRDKSLFLLFPWLKDIVKSALVVYIGRLQDAVLIREEEEEFDGYMDWVEYHASLTSGIKGIIEELCKHMPTEVISTMNESIGRLLQTPCPKKIGSPTVLDAGSQHSNRYYSSSTQWDVNSMLLRSAVQHACSAAVAVDESESFEHANQRLQVQQILISLLGTVASWQPAELDLIVARLELLFACLPVLRLVDNAPFLNQVFSIYFQHLYAEPDALGIASSAATVTTRSSAGSLAAERVYTCSAQAIVKLCDLCTEISFYSSICSEISPQLLKMLDDCSGAPVDENSLRHFRTNTVQRCMMESLIIMSENMSDESCRRSILQSAMGPFIRDWQTMVLEVGTSQETLLRCLIEFAHLSAQESLQATSSSGQTSHRHKLGTLQHMLETFISVAKRIRLPNYNFNDLSQLSMDIFISQFPFAAVWVAVLPGVETLMQQFDFIFSSGTRIQLESQLGKPFSDLFYLPTRGEMYREVGLSSNEFQIPGSPSTIESAQVGQLVARTAATWLSDCRKLIYHIIGLSSSHKFIYMSDSRQAFPLYLASSFPEFDNLHATLAMNRILNFFIPQAPEFYHDQLFTFLKAFFEGMMVRLTTALSRGSCEEEDAESRLMKSFSDTYLDPSLMLRFKYKYCSVALGIAGSGVVTGEGASDGDDGINIDHLRERITTNLTRAFADIIQLLCGSKAVKFDNPTSGDDQMVEETAAICRDAPFVFGPRAVAVLPLFLQSSAALFHVKDSTVLRKALAVANALLRRCRVTEEPPTSNESVVQIVGRDMFHATLELLLREEQHITGIEGEMIDYLVDAYGSLVLGIDCNTFGITAAASAGAVGDGSSASPCGQVSSIRSVIVDIGPKTHRPGQEQAGCISTGPREVMASAPGVTRDALFELEKILVASYQSKKKRKDVFKDFLAEMLKFVKSSSSSENKATRVSALLSSATAVDDIISRMKRSKPKALSVIDSDVHDGILSSIFH